MARTVTQLNLEGRNMVHDALMSEMKIRKVKIATTLRDDPRIKEIVSLAKQKGVVLELVRGEEIERESEGNAQGVIAMVDIPEPLSLEELLKKKRDAFILLLNRIDYEQNLGAILRSAWAAGVDAVVASPNGVHELTSVVAKVSMGGAAFVPLIGMSLFQAIDLLEKYAVKIIGVEVKMGEIYTQANLKGAVAFLMGGEAAGISEPLVKKCNGFINIPMIKGVASLNVSVASALILFEKVRQERES